MNTVVNGINSLLDMYVNPRVEVKEFQVCLRKM
jgi:hypothetical protein